MASAHIFFFLASTSTLTPPRFCVPASNHNGQQKRFCAPFGALLFLEYGNESLVLEYPRSEVEALQFLEPAPSVNAAGKAATVSLEIIASAQPPTASVLEYSSGFPASQVNLREDCLVSPFSGCPGHSWNGRIFFTVW